MFSARFIGVLSIINRKIRSLKASGNTPCGQNVFIGEEIWNLFAFNASSKKHPKSFITGVIFSVALTYAFSPTELYSLKLNQVAFNKIDGEEVIRIAGRIGGIDG